MQRTKFHLLMAGVYNDRMLHHTHQLYNFVRFEEMLDWLIKNRITGKRFLEFVDVENEGSMLRVGSVILTRVHRDREPRKILAGRDFRTET